ncbi:AAA family ATPase [Janthinobacterium lividum]|uniref:AAA family ATPase n=1 Tax=Janthinobacterium lividum TaxID=29581 RepID=UPI000893E36F|nr:AAA family ATPase [Janthinobacterium lividum]MCC7716925.1 AAA family ATPase [Janthinobacterium lividum]OEZ53512.1 hypothetical protein JANLI_41920 [Janthinobacterium lividum]WQE31873.1 AAA family ATPase [Janthinobacterium lividum]STS86137.1 Predicted ATP-binding protein involved in virulence [Janthinobacterium lividum]
MEIIYIWVKEYKNLKDFELNLSSTVQFKYSKEKNSVQRIGTKKIPANFFPYNVTDVVALIGKNGSGKSNALELICNSLKGSKTSILQDFFVITKQSGKKRYIGYYNFTSPTPPTSRCVDFEEHRGNISSLDVVFFSNVNDQRRNNFSKEVFDLSENSKNLRSALRWDLDFSKQISFLESPYFSELEIEEPIAAHITVNVFNTFTGIRQNLLSSKNLSELHKFIRRRTKDLQPRTRFALLSQYLYYVGFLNAYLGSVRFSDRGENHLVDLDFDVGYVMDRFTSTEEVLAELIRELKKRCMKFGIFKSEKFDIFSHPRLADGILLKQQFDFIENLPAMCSDLDMEYSSDAIRERSQQSFIIRYSGYSRNFLQSYAANMSFIRFINLDWLGLSSGQKAYLNLFSTLTSALDKVAEDNVILLIDEGDLYLHPKWQVDFLYRLLTILSIATNRKIQLILTSHSPLLISDLPRQNIAILGDRESDAQNFNHSLETFGANLYDLYAGPLFLEGMTSGLFSSLKIRDFMKLLDNKSYTAIEKEYIEDFLNILGDKIFKFKFEEIYNNKNVNSLKEIFNRD